MRKYLVIVISLFFLCISIRLSWAGYQSPSEIFSALAPASEDGDDLDIFLVIFYVRSDGTYIEPAAGYNVNVYGASGLLRSFNTSRGADFEAEYNFYDQYIYLEGSGKWKNHIYVYNYNGNLVSTISSYSGNFESALSNGDFITHILKTENYYRYSISGQLLKTYASRPLELGVAKNQAIGNGKYKTTIMFDDRAYSLIMDWDVGKSVKILRDENNNVYLLDAGSAYKYSPCGKLLGKVDVPSDVVFREENVEDREPEYIKHDLYGNTQIDIHGNVYTWKKTPSKYHILKWTWVDDPNAPSGPDVPTGLSLMPSTSGLYLTWTASVQDPGCVTGYEVSRATSAGGVGTTVTTVDKGVVKYNDTTAEVGTTYYYKVRAVSGSEYSAYTTEVSGKR
jgi:hypothetical protein